MRRYTIQIIPQDGKVREIRTTQRALTLLIILIAVIIGALIYLSVNIGKIYVKNIEYNLLKHRVVRLENRDREIEQLNQEIRKFYVLSDKLNKALGLGITPTNFSREENDKPSSRDEENLEGKEMQEEATRLRAFIPDIMPAMGGWISRGYSSDHKAIDISLKEGTSVFTTIEGEIIFAGNQEYLGKTIQVQNDEGFMTLYGHLSRILVRKGSKIKKGEIIGLSGNTGRSDAPHLHYAIKMQGRWVNPINYLPIRR